MSLANPTQKIARRYYDAWTSGDTTTVQTLLSPDFRLTAGDMTIDGREAFLDVGAFQMYDTTPATAPSGSSSSSPYEVTRSRVRYS